MNAHIVEQWTKGSSSYNLVLINKFRAVQKEFDAWNHTTEHQREALGATVAATIKTLEQF